MNANLFSNLFKNRHPVHRMHDNSLDAYAKELPRLSRRAMLIHAEVVLGGPGTDRQIMNRMGFTDMNAVRPRISEMIDLGVLREVATKKCPTTGKRVRVVDLSNSNNERK